MIAAFVIAAGHAVLLFVWQYFSHARGNNSILIMDVSQGASAALVCCTEREYISQLRP